MRTIKVKGMTCEHCVMAVKKALSEVEGIENVNVDLARGEATFEELKPVQMETIRERIVGAGYEIG
ncbi:mercury transporter [candidate division TA06 bacterium DG_24]|jgi:copper chaperone|uniref:Mercury transporter n=3 Tax=Bacteria division TA06 TaxID=1156500 RepID=A0A0S8JJR1_UNCT6|nr:MAG: mercury transporter [candidate division TA06 bacterium DG_24]KPK70238.1 MAG: mercury transporter [candidate division TA06 bacterium SM23_40]KPL09967.1 MAG: mercury transporter [candidate division TA06 bacterium SM1_40]